MASLAANNLSRPQYAASKPRRDLLRELKRHAQDAIAAEIPAGARVALVGYPRHPNVGDSAIWLGARMALRRAGARIVYVSDQSQYNARQMGERLAGGVVVILGGGNLGDLWPREQNFRETILRDFRDNRIVQLPQSIHFDDPGNVRPVREVLRCHRSFSLFVRDKKSARAAEELLDIPAKLAPDMALTLRPLSRRRHPRVPYLWQHRTDKEASCLPAIPGSLDWLDMSPLERRMDRGIPLARQFGRLGRVGRAAYRGHLDMLCALRVRRGLDFLSDGEVVVSDRLHGVILSLLAGIPVVAIDNRVGKLSAFIRTWLGDCSGVVLAVDLDEARHHVARLSRR